MQQLRSILIGALLALALMAPAAASAAPTTVCSVSTTPCPASSVYVGAVGFELARTGAGPVEQAVISGTMFGVPTTVTCSTLVENGHGPGGEGSDGMGTILVNPGAPVAGNINSLWFFNCVDQGGGACTAVTDAAATIWPDTITNAALAPGSDGTLAVSVNLVSVTCALGTCNYGPGVVQASWYNAGNPARPDTTGPDAIASQFHMAGVTLPTASSACSNATWSANYAIRAGGDTTFGGNLWVR